MERACLSLPSKHLQRRDVVARALLRLALSHRERAELRPFFELHPSELSFLRAIVRVHTRFHVYRTHQKSACGDFVVIDMSSPRIDHRRVFAVELKSGGALSESPSVQLARIDRALRELRRRGVIGQEVEPRILRGSEECVLRAIAAREAQAPRMASIGST